MTLDAQTARDDVAFLRQLIETGDNSLPSWGEGYLAAGTIYGTQMLMHGAQLLGWLPVSGLAALAIGLGPTAVFLVVLSWINWRHRSARPAAAGRAIGITFGAVGVGNLALAAVIGSVAWREQSLTIWLIYPCAVFVLQGAAWLVAALIKRRGWMGLVAGGWLACGVAMAVVVGSITAYVLLAGVGIWACMALPGWIMVRQARRQAAVATAS